MKESNEMKLLKAFINAAGYEIEEEITENGVYNCGVILKTKVASRFKPPTVDELAAYVAEKDLAVDAGQFINFYESKGWKVGKTKMKCWKSAARNWSSRGKQDEKNGYKQRANTAAAVGEFFEKEANAAARRLSESVDAEVQSYIPAKVGRAI